MYHRNVGDALIDGVIEVHDSSQPEPVRHGQPLPTLLASVGTSSAPPPHSLTTTVTFYSSSYQSITTLPSTPTTKTLLFNCYLSQPLWTYGGESVEVVNRSMSSPQREHPVWGPLFDDPHEKVDRIKWLSSRGCLCVNLKLAQKKIGSILLKSAQKPVL